MRGVEPGEVLVEAADAAHGGGPPGRRGGPTETGEQDAPNPVTEVEAIVAMVRDPETTGVVQDDPAERPSPSEHPVDAGRIDAPAIVRA
ncbi:hypothetical protein [Embleya sp. NPDC005575]|uniref:hypothetical protein n=1 Tax=Embleya sp. NPDC005575 TaxID=3156892 RepID=UPI00339E2AE1